MHFDSKVAVVVHEDLAVWQKLNVACFLSGGLVASQPELGGEPYIDASGNIYSPLVRQPILVFGATTEELKRTLRGAIECGMKPSIYTRQLFVTNNDANNRAAVASVPTDALDLVGVAIHGERKDVDKVVKSLRLHA